MGCSDQIWKLSLENVVESICTVQPQLSGPHLSRSSVIQTSWRPEYTLPHMHRRCERWSFVCVVTSWVMRCGLCRLALGKIVLLDYFSEHCWPWSYCIGIVDRLDIINQVRNVGTSVNQTFHLSSMVAISLWTKGFGRTLQTCLGQNWLTRLPFWTLLAMIILYRYRW